MHVFDNRLLIDCDSSLLLASLTARCAHAIWRQHISPVLSPFWTSRHYGWSVLIHWHIRLHHAHRIILLHLSLQIARIVLLNCYLFFLFLRFNEWILKFEFRSQLRLSLLDKCLILFIQYIHIRYFSFLQGLSYFCIWLSSDWLDWRDLIV